jgi:hypothetical protein
MRHACPPSLSTAAGVLRNFVLLLGLLRVPVTGRCEPFCHSACVDLNGDVEAECGTCAEGHTCRPGATGFPATQKNHATNPSDVLPANDSARRDDEHDDAGMHSFCGRMVSDGRCATEPDEMQLACACACGEDKEGCARRRSPSTPPAEQDRQRTLPLGRTQESWCGDPDEEERLRDRGYFVWRQAVPSAELRAMQQHVYAMPDRLGALCGVPYEQQPGCVLHRELFRATYPRTHAAVRARMADWVRTGFHRHAGLGWPLEIMVRQSTPHIATSCLCAIRTPNAHGRPHRLHRVPSSSPSTSGH